MKKRIAQFFTIFIIGFIIYQGCNWYDDSRVSPVGSTMSEDNLFHDIKLILKKRLRVNTVQYFEKYEDPDTLGTAKKGYNMTNVLDITARIPGYNENSDLRTPFNVHAAMQVWLYLKDREAPYPIEGINVGVSRGRFIMDSLWRVMVTREEFETLYASMQNVEMDSQLMIEKLAAKWVEESKYTGWWGEVMK
ncbi:hypothetical protein [Paenibacillus sp. sgz302251]|uniref:hypothetical protein n=1 Tax=Paenibacillus sp. sgz302251 TaxID=3414493 RepID=UPI003C7AAF17